jgi:S-adenosyl methyltransferase
VRLRENYKSTGAVPYIPQPIEEIHRRFEGLQLVDPGLVPVTLWRPHTPAIGQVVPLRETTGVGRKL